jgi:hypothetical protein
VARWRRAQSLLRTIRQRPDLIAARGGLDEADLAVLAEFDLDQFDPHQFDPHQFDLGGGITGTGGAAALETGLSSP